MLKRVFALAAAFALLSVLGVAEARTRRVTPLPENSRVLVMLPDVQLALLTAAGVPEPREDWSIAGRDNLAQGLTTVVEREHHQPSALDPSTAMEGRVGQIIRLHDAVSSAMLADRMGFMKLPTHRNNAEWTLGEGVQELGATYNADYALFVVARGSYASGARTAAAIVGLVAGIYIPTGGQQALASLVDLRTGKIVWFGYATAAPGADMREPEGAGALLTQLMRGAPL